MRNCYHSNQLEIFISLWCNKHKYVDGYTGIESEMLIENNNQGWLEFDFVVSIQSSSLGDDEGPVGLLEEFLIG